MSWPTVELQDVCTFENGDRGRNYPGKSTLVDEGIPFVNAGNLHEGAISSHGLSYISENHYTRLSNGKFGEGDFLFCLRGTLGKFAFVDREINGAIASSLIIVRPKDQLHPAFLNCFLGSDLCVAQIDLFKNGAAQPNLAAASLKKFQIPLPPLDEQKRIAGILDQADALRRLRARALDKLGTLGQAIFHEMFWDVQRKRLDDLTIKITDGTHQAPEWAEDGVPFVFVSNIRNQEISLKTSKFVTPDEYDRLIKRTALAEGDVVYTCVGSYGNSAVVDTNTDFVFQRHIAHIKPDLQHLDSVFLSYGLESPLVRAQADKTATGIAQKTVTLSALKNFEFPAPDVDAQIAFRGRIDDLKASRISARKALEQSESLFTALQHRAFRGEL